MASPLDYNTQYLHYWSSDPRDILLGAQHNSLSSKYSGISICHPIYDEKAMTSAMRIAIHSAILNTEATKPSLLQTPHCSPEPLLQAWDFYRGLQYSWKSRLEQPEPYLAPRFSQGYPEAKWFVKIASNDPILNARHAIMSGIGKCEKPLDKNPVSLNPNETHNLPLPHRHPLQ
eukprot:1138629-Pelagomonas_calceolata.AAC.3